jgi:predicted nucleotide-binding protein
LDRLLEAKTTYQYAIFIFTPDDTITIRGEDVLVTRDNVIFEAGLFMSHLGRKRTFIVDH